MIAAIYEGRKYSKIIKFDCHILDFSNDRGGYSTVLPISSLAFREEHPQYNTASVHVTKGSQWTMFEIVDEVKNSHVVLINNLCANEIEKAIEAARSQKLLKEELCS